jgi:hypothetical protein
MPLRGTLNNEDSLCRSGFHARHAFVGIRIPTYEQRTKELFGIENAEIAERTHEKISAGFAVSAAAFAVIMCSASCRDFLCANVTPLEYLLLPCPLCAKLFNKKPENPDMENVCSGVICYKSIPVGERYTASQIRSGESWQGESS